MFINDKGVDFKSRLYKVKAVDLKYEEIERTHHVLKVLYNIYLYFKEKGTDTGRSTDIAYPKEILWNSLWDCIDRSLDSWDWS